MGTAAGSKLGHLGFAGMQRSAHQHVLGREGAVHRQCALVAQKSGHRATGTCHSRHLWMRRRKSISHRGAAVHSARHAVRPHDDTRHAASRRDATRRDATRRGATRHGATRHDATHRDFTTRREHARPGLVHVLSRPRARRVARTWVALARAVSLLRPWWHPR